MSYGLFMIFYIGLVVEFELINRGVEETYKILSSGGLKTGYIFPDIRILKQAIILGS